MGVLAILKSFVHQPENSFIISKMCKDYSKWPHEVLNLSLLEFSFSFQVWDTAAKFENKVGAKSQVINKTSVSVEREPGKVLNW